MPKTSLTAGRVSSFSCTAGKGQEHLWDSEAKGLGLRVTAANAKSYVFQGKLHGQSLRITIGSPDAWSIGDARKEARRLRMLMDQGIDPRQDKADRETQAATARAEAKRKNLTLGEVWPLYLAARKARWGDRHYNMHVSLAAKGGEVKQRGKGMTVAGPLYPLMSIRLSDITADAVAAWLENEAATRPTNAHQCFRMLRTFIAWTEDIPEYKGLVPKDACSARRVKDVMPKSKAKEGDTLQREQLPMWFEAVLRINNRVISTYLQALLLTGARREEMAGLRWEDVNFQWRSITIRDKVKSKGGEDGTRTIPLTPYLATLLAALPRRNEWVFSSPMSASGRLAEPRKAHNEALQAAGLPHVSIHGLRRSFGTLCEWVEVPAGISAQIMGHAPSALAEKHYRRRPLDLLRNWHDRIEAWILDQGGIEYTSMNAGLHVLRTA